MLNKVQSKKEEKVLNKEVPHQKESTAMMQV